MMNPDMLAEREAEADALERHMATTPSFEPEPFRASPKVNFHKTVESHNANPTMFRLDDLRRLWASGFVNRWHCNFDHRLRMSGDMNGGHCHRVAMLYLGLFWYRRNTPEMTADHFNHVLIALMHDAPEVVSGDIPQPGKQRVFELKVGDKAAEVYYWNTVGDGRNWSEKPLAIGLCDLLDAILFVKQRAPDLLDRDDWKGDIATCLGMATDCGVMPEVEALIYEPWPYGV